MAPYLGLLIDVDFVYVEQRFDNFSVTAVCSVHQRRFVLNAGQRTAHTWQETEKINDPYRDQRLRLLSTHNTFVVDGVPGRRRR